MKEIRKTVLYVDFSKTNFVLQIVQVEIHYWSFSESLEKVHKKNQSVAAIKQF